MDATGLENSLRKPYLRLLHDAVEYQHTYLPNIYYKRKEFYNVIIKLILNVLGDGFSNVGLPVNGSRYLKSLCCMCLKIFSMSLITS